MRPPSDLLNLAERWIARAKGKGWGAKTTAAEAAALARFAPAPKVVVDVGGHVGHWTAAMRARVPVGSARFLVIEPNAGNAAKLRERFADAADVTVVEAALSDRDGEATLYSEIDGSTRASLSAPAGDTPPPVALRVATRRLDSLLTEHGLAQVDVLKLDIEGHEYAVLASLDPALLGSIGVIQFEFGGPSIETRTFFRDFWLLLSPAFRLYRLSPFGPLAVDRYRRLDETFAVTNYLCVNRGRG